MDSKIKLMKEAVELVATSTRVIVVMLSETDVKIWREFLLTSAEIYSRNTGWFRELNLRITLLTLDELNRNICKADAERLPRFNKGDALLIDTDVFTLVGRDGGMQRLRKDGFLFGWPPPGTTLIKGNRNA